MEKVWNASPASVCVFHTLHLRANMFVRFKPRTLKFWGDEALEVILVSNHRVGQRVQQRCVKYLGSIRLTRLDSDFRTKEFWQKVRKSLGTLGLHPNLQRSIEDKISERVPMSEEMNHPGKNRVVPAGFRERMRSVSQKNKRGR